MSTLLNPLKLYFAKTKEGAKIPTKREEDAAYDIYACFDEDFLMIRPHETVLVPTGIASAFSSDYVAILKERGSNGSKGIGQRAGVLDSGFRGEWQVPLTNHNVEHLIILKDEADIEKVKIALMGSKDISVPFIVYPYSKAIAQCIMVEVPKLIVEELDYNTLKQFESERGIGMLGSSGK